MKRTETGTPVLSWALSIRNEKKELLEQCLKSIRERTPQAEIVIVDNCSISEETLEVAQKYADIFSVYRGPKGTWKETDPHTFDMAASRQHGFNLATGRWISWIDSDDRLPGPEEVEKLLKLNDRWRPMPPAGAIVHDDDSKTPRGLEDILVMMEEKCPQAEIVWCPYLYAKDKDGAAFIWQERERILKRSALTRWRWSEPSHEILVPIRGHNPSQKIDLPHLLFVHEREFSAESAAFSTGRHFDVLHQQYIDGERTTRRSLYLAAYAVTLCPEREKEFIADAHTCATTPHDRYRCMHALGQMQARHGMMMDALEAFGAATHLCPHLPDAWFTGAELWIKMEDWPRAALWLEEGLKCAPGHTHSEINPRFHALRYPVMLSEVYRKLAKVHVRCGSHEQASKYLEAALAQLHKVKDHPSIGTDKAEADVRGIRMQNDYLAQNYAMAIQNIATFLIRNDEPKKVIDLLKAVPWNLKDHPIVMSLEKTVAPIERHIAERSAYQEYYADDIQGGYLSTPDKWLDVATSGLPRVPWIANWIKENCPKARVLEIGPFDGILGIPVMRACPEISYVGIDVCRKAIEAFKVRMKEFSLENRAEVLAYDGNLESEELKKFYGQFDVVIWCEVIEHVPDPLTELKKIQKFMKSGATLFMSTPWGSFDAGNPPPLTVHGSPRGSLGHLRVMTARETVKCFDDAGMSTVNMECMKVYVDCLGDTMHGMAKNTPYSSEPPMNVVVVGALWDWHGRLVHAQGMGASEKSIVQFTEALVTKGRKAEVYGPVPIEDTFNGVRYWPREQVRHVKEGKIIVSRSPGSAGAIDEIMNQKRPKILWLQDAHYPDLDAKICEEYEKIVVVSEWHKQAMHARHGAPLEKMEVIYNPLDPRLYTIKEKPERKRDSFIYCSSPDRALIPLLKLWPRILEKLPKATLDIFYGWRGCEKLGMGSDSYWTQLYQQTRREFEVLKYQKGVMLRDMVNPTELARAFMSAGAWLYPCHGFHETGCSSATESRAAGCVPVSTMLAALNETARCKQGFIVPLSEADPDWENKFIEYAVAATQVSDAERAEMSQSAIEQYSISAMLPRWERLL